MNETDVISDFGSSKPTVLLVCRSGKTLGALGSIVSKAGLTALTAQTAADAWEIMRSGWINCVVQDLTNVNSDAMAFFRSCRTSRNMFGIPFLFLTTEDCLPAKFEGVWPETARDGWLSLPCPAPQFLSAVNNLLSATQRRRGRPVHFPKAIETPATPPEPVHPVSKRYASGTFTAASSNSHLLAVTADALENALFSGKLGTLQFSQILGLIEPLRLTGVLKLFDGVRAGNVHLSTAKFITRN